MKRSQGPGRTIARGADGFDAAVLGTSFNAQDPGRRPDLVIQANSADEVAAAVRRARESDVRSVPRVSRISIASEAESAAAS